MHDIGEYPLADPLIDQLLGFGHASLASLDDAGLQTYLQNTGNGLGATNRVELPGPPDRQGNQVCEDGNNKTTLHAILILFLSQDVPGVCSAPSICITGYRVHAVFDKHGAASDSVPINAVLLETEECIVTRVDLNNRVEMIQQGKKGKNFGTLSVGVLRLRALPKDGVCPLP